MTFGGPVFKYVLFLQKINNLVLDKLVALIKSYFPLFKIYVQDQYL
jgi:hypothetical protein